VKIEEFQQILDLKSGTLMRKMKFTDKEGNQTSLVTKRFVSMENQHVLGIEWEIVPENWSGTMKVLSSIDGGVVNNNVARYSDLNKHHLNMLQTGHLEENIISLAAETNQSRITMALAARTQVIINNEKQQVQGKFITGENKITNQLSFEARQAQVVQIEKLVTVYTSKDVAISEPYYQAIKSVHRLADFNSLLLKHTSIWENLWKRNDTKIHLKEKSEDQAILRLHTFHIMQTVSGHSFNMDVGVPSRGWHGEAYRGHIFWDELYIMPFLILHQPQVARHLLMYRYRRLGEARFAAKEEGFPGAMFPWQSGSDGREESQKTHLNPESGNWLPDISHHQRHINTTIVYNVWQYYQATKDMEFFTFYGAELILSIAKFWAGIAHFNPKSQRFEIHGVMGPDEYHTKYPGSDEPGLKNNAYTNFMAVWVLQRAVETLGMFDEKQKKQLMDKVGIQEESTGLWEEISAKMFIPFHDGVISQFEGYEKLEEFDWPTYREKHGEVMRLDRILESEGDTPNRYKVSKQADVLMIFYLLSSSEVKKTFKCLGYEFNIQTDIEKNIRYYQERTSHGSTLSKLVHSWVYARLNRNNSWKSFKQALMSDFKDVQGGTTAEGIHLGAMAGTVDLIQRCYTGMEIKDDILWLNPRLPENIDDIILSIRFRSHWFKLYINHERVKLDFEKGWAPPVFIGINEKVYKFENNSSEEIKLVIR
jgi:trehalose/maltose hydrolase-like predicted phosphorylase